MKFFTKFLMSFLLILIANSCSQKPAKIVNNSRNFYGKNSRPTQKLNQKFYQEGNLKPASNNSLKTVIVEESDTLYSVAKRYRVGLQDLISANNLRPPYILKSGTRLTIPAMEYHNVQEGETLYAISRQYDMKIDDLIEINGLEEPYRVKSGQRIRISKSTKSISNDYAKKEEKIKEGDNFIESGIKRLTGDASFKWPIRGTIISGFGPKSEGLYNDGINIKSKNGEEVKAAQDGIVAYVGNELKGYGNLVIIKHSGGWITAYAHLSNSTVSRGQKVDQGQKIGYVGSSGNVTSPQLYFGLRKGREAVNPKNYLK